MRNTKFALIIIFFSSCGLEKMVNQYETVEYVVTPSVLETHGNKVEVKITGNFPKKYFHKQALVEINPVLINEDGSEELLNLITLQGEHTSGGDATIFYETGGNFSYKDVIDYNENMRHSHLELRAKAILNDESKPLGPVTIANGVIATSQRVRNDEEFILVDHGYEKETIISETATIYFLVNQSSIRTSEISKDDVKKLQDFANNGYITKSFEIKSYASPEGALDLNEDLSNERNATTLNFAKSFLKELNVNGVGNDSLYLISSIGEDWDGFYNLVESSTISDRNSITGIVKREKDPEKREQVIRDMAAVYDAVEKDILPFLRKAEITINSYKPKRIDQEIFDLARNNPRLLDHDELLYILPRLLTDLTSAEFVDIFTNKFGLQRSEEKENQTLCKLYNNTYALVSNYPNKFVMNLESPRRISRLISCSEDIAIVENCAIIASREGDFLKSQELFDRANTKRVNQAILDIRKGDYKRAMKYYENDNSYNAVLLNILVGNYDNKCNDGTASCYYLNAIGGARKGDIEFLIVNLKNAIDLNPSYKDDARKDREFDSYRDNESLKLLLSE